MDISLSASQNSGVATYQRTQEAAQKKEEDTGTERAALQGREIYDTVEISDEAREYMAQKEEEREAEMETLDADLPSWLAQVRALKESQALLQRGGPYAEVDPDGSIYRREYWTAYIGQLQEAVKHIENYYAAAQAENSRMGTSDFLFHIRNKYIAEDSPIFCGHMSAGERAMAYKQEKTLYFGGNVTLGDPYALASHGGLLNIFDVEKNAKKAAEEYLNGLLAQRNHEGVL